MPGRLLPAALAAALLALAAPGCRSPHPAPAAPQAAQPAGRDHARPHAAEPSAEDRALAERVETLLAQSTSTVGREQGLWLTGDWQSGWLPTLKGEKEGGPDDLAHARRMLSGVANNLERSLTWPAPPTIRVPFTTQPPVVDGKLDDACWKQAWTSTGLYEYDSTVRLDTPAMTWRAAWDGQNLYFGYECADARMDAPIMARDGPVWNYDCVEVFLLPELRLGVYWEIVVSPTGMLFDALQSKRFDAWGTFGRVEENVQGLQYAAQCRGTPNDRSDRDTGYTVEIAVPWRELPTYMRGNPPRNGDRLRFMLARLDGRGAGNVRAYGFIPFMTWGHNIWNYATMELEGGPKD